MPVAMKSVTPRKAKKVKSKFCECGSGNLFKEFSDEYKGVFRSIYIREGKTLQLESRLGTGILIYEIALNYCPKCGRKIKK